jgi:hypothetical protein
MPLPGDFITHSYKEATLADKVWARVKNDPPDVEGVLLYEAAEAIPWGSRHIVQCAEWMIAKRFAANNEFSPGINQSFGGPIHYNAKEIAGVEHFYCGAMIGTVFGPGAGPIIGAALSFGWDVLKPLAKLFTGKKIKDLQYDLKQFGGPDLQGVSFGSFYKVMWW